MSGNLSVVFTLVAVAMIWGITNPLVKAGSKGVEKIENSWFDRQKIKKIKKIKKIVKSKSKKKKTKKKHTNQTSSLPSPSPHFFLFRWKQTKFLYTRWQYLFPFLTNLAGSVLFFITLGNANISLVVPITNSLTFLFTELTATFFLKEKSSNKLCELPFRRPRFVLSFFPPGVHCDLIYPTFSSSSSSLFLSLSLSPFDIF